MKMQKSLVILIIYALILFLSCEDEDTDNPFDNGNLNKYGSCLSGHFYYANEEKIFIDSSMQNDYLLIGFKQSYSIEEINAFLDSQTVFTNENVVESIDKADDDYKLIIRKFKAPKSCSEINETIEELHGYEKVSFASYTYEGIVCAGLRCTDLKSYCNEIVVSLHDSSDIHELYKLVENTDTWIEKETNLYTLIGADKNSKGNALQLANLFHESGLFDFSHPNFNYFYVE